MTYVYFIAYALKDTLKHKGIIKNQEIVVPSKISSIEEIRKIERLLLLSLNNGGKRYTNLVLLGAPMLLRIEESDKKPS